MVEKRNSKKNKKRKQSNKSDKSTSFGRDQFLSMIDKIGRLGQIYKDKFDRKLKQVQSKLKDVSAATYVEMADDLRKQILTAIESKANKVAELLSKKISENESRQTRKKKVSPKPKR